MENTTIEVSKVPSDIEIAQAAKLQHINDIAIKLGIAADQLEHYGKFKAKLPLTLIDPAKAEKSNLILVTAINPTPAGEGKTTTTIGLTEGLNRIGKQATAVLREPSLGPVFGVKGGAAGGGYSQVVPMEDINLHFTGDFSAIEKANNLLAALIDNNIQNKEGNNLGIDPRTVVWKRVMDMNDRALRNIIVALGGKQGGMPRETGFNITAASEIMAILCLSSNLEDLKTKIGNIYIGDTYAGKPVYAKQLNAQGSMAALLKDAIMPNLVQTLEGNPAIIHGGPFANIAQGTNTLVATKMGMSLSDYVVTEAGFGADLGAEKFLHIKCGYGKIAPKVVVIVATIRALKYHGGATMDTLKTENLEALQNGMANLEQHIANIGKFGLPAVVAVNKFFSDTQAELDMVYNHVKSIGARVAICEGWEKGGAGMEQLANEVTETIALNQSNFKPLYNSDDSVEQKIEAIAKNIYGADGVDYAAKAQTGLKKIYRLGMDKLPVCMAKTQYSFSDNPKLLGRPKGFRITVREFEFAAGAGFLIPICGDMMRMPGLPQVPAAEAIDIDANGLIGGLF
ncbi:MAG: formate--tetrahydrofolate ligase [Bacteroidota bacterium]|nr:formate--tetrahydrofolate ligase [Bacteroidota bacterium]